MAFTLDTYAHVMPGMQPQAAELFRELVFGHDAGDSDEGNPDEDDEEADDNAPTEEDAG